MNEDNNDIRIQGLLIDLDGVLYLNHELVPGAIDAISEIRTAGVPFRFVTNTTRMNPASISGHMENLGFEASIDEIISPPVAAAAFMEKNDLQSYHLLASPDLADAFSSFQAQDEGADAVIIGDLGEVFTFDRLNTAFRIIMDGAQILALHKDRFWQTESGPRLDTGPFVSALEFASGKQAIVVGKPEKAFFDIALQNLQIEAPNVAMVGDSIETDIGGAMESRLQGILVRTGNYQFHDESESQVSPDFIIDSIADLPALLRSPLSPQQER
ncbi:MAG: TIGR01458 family HAD-type hydrolase [Candidatus Latescibacteria bacterium]|jgi:HAD superfamily hydrolase (TIGR01458 family)|nr:TIGR01458 family HAD-type hydrolase [Candidatus Latescibacterota bacterium]